MRKHTGKIQEYLRQIITVANENNVFREVLFLILVSNWFSINLFVTYSGLELLE